LNNKPIHNQMNLLSAILLALYELKVPENGTINVLDFGGSMGGNYFFIKHQLDSYIKLNWTICETEATAKAAKEHFTEEGLTFVSSLDNLSKSQRFDIILTSSTLQYTDEPEKYFNKLKNFNHPFLIIDRFPLAMINKDRLTIQKTAKSVYTGSYPAWFFSKEKWIALISASYVIKLNWDSTDSALLDFKEIICQGYLLKRK